MSIENFAAAAIDNKENEIDQLKLAKKISLSHRQTSPPALNKSSVEVGPIKLEEEAQVSRIGYFWRTITSVFVSEQTIESKQELEARLAI